MSWMAESPRIPIVDWPFRIPDSEAAEVRKHTQELAGRSPFGWGHTIDFGPFVIEGLMQNNYLRIAGFLDVRGRRGVLDWRAVITHGRPRRDRGGCR
jgi:hypothetical protein